jgi:hypothetical protein
MRQVAAADVLAVAGLGLAALGLWLIYAPLAPIAVGLALLALGVLGSSRGRP